MLNSNASALDPARGFTQYGGGQNVAGASGNLGGQTGLQGGMPSVRGNLAGLQPGQNTAGQQMPQGRFGQQAQNQALQSNLQQLTQLQQGRAQVNGAGAVVAGNAGAAAGRANPLGLANMNPPQLSGIRPGDRTGLGLTNLGAQGGPPQGLNLQGGYGNQASLAAALTNQHTAANNARQLAGVNNVQLNTSRLPMPNMMGPSMLQQQQQPGMTTTGQDIMSLLTRKQQGNQGLAAAVLTAVQHTSADANAANAYAALLKQARPGQPGGLAGSAVADGFSIANEVDFPALSAAPQRNGDDVRPGYGGLGQGAGSVMGGRAGFPGVLGDPFGQDAVRAQVADMEHIFRMQQQAQQQQAQQQQQARPAGATLMQANKQTLLGGQLGGQLLGGPGQTADAGMKGGQHSMAGQPVLPSGPPPDKWGFLAIMPLLKMADPDATMLALGTDLTTLGLDLNSNANLHRNLVSPLSDHPIKVEPEYELPACYKHAPQRLQPGYLSRFKEETLFYIFYSMPADEAQLIAADELSTRGWLFHRRMRMWMLPAPGLTQKTPRGEQGAFLVFNPTLWEVEQKQDLEVSYEECEAAPRLPRIKPGPGAPGGAMPPGAPGPGPPGVAPVGAAAGPPGMGQVGQART
mmetsp:Transcript_9112/g.15903  ORF Transcript_9112/g.15903 Transcript_9112/m.15903 type:complete len:631 (+) Transcript_9112:92-1984(+)|eukprot:CAMPEP_0119103246 /NCGR_PEP_ID=MMETSP1180-20130426/1728_1 /TAXON_ID=3052 ORGANISM="Chlamydomonas cf sp, Strain CCMP681" /NCGR_SAMPLE_ID=MMETSP1180 /ASSEMBLY_ACC=CAM_ASM_000741 /LENGTH=630 /DNA_ID=CAMNT_0007087699 /DNA_START=92 /DNA_END=1984 /DNA_ORIENTATION=+